MIRWLAEFIDTNTERCEKQEGKEMNIEKWDKLDQVERFRLIRGRKRKKDQE